MEINKIKIPLSTFSKSHQCAVKIDVLKQVNLNVLKQVNSFPLLIITTLQSCNGLYNGTLVAKHIGVRTN